MDGVPFSTQFLALAVLLLCSAFFSLAETAMMASNRYRLRHQAAQGHRGATLALELLSKTDKMLGVILLGNNLINAGAATLVSLITIELFGEDKWALGAGTLLITFLILVFSEITPKIIGATHADRLAVVLGYLLWPLLRLTYPVVWFVNLFASALLRLLHLRPPAGHEAPRLNAEELRSVVLESSHFIPAPHRSILVNLFDLDQVTVADIMTPRGEIETLDLLDSMDIIRSRLSSSFHSRLPVYENEPDNIVGILQVRRVIAGAIDGELQADWLRQQLTEPYFIPATTPIYAQLQFFRDNRQRTGLVVDEYGELLGLVTLEDIIEEIVGKFTTGMPGGSNAIAWNEEGAALVDGGHNLREINRALGLSLPTDGPKTLNGLIVEQLQDIPEVGICLKIADVSMEIVQTQDRRIRMVRILRPQAGAD